MGLIVSGGDRCYISCDDPHARGCVSKTKEMRGQAETGKMARQQSWFKNETTGKWICPPCNTKEDHDVRKDFVGVNARERLTCYTPTCNDATLVVQPYMTQEVADKKCVDFRAAHPSQNIRNEGWRG